MANLALNGGEKLICRDFIRWPVADERDTAAVSEVILSGKWFRYAGTKTDEIEKKLAACFGAKYVQAVTSGTSALENALYCLGIGAGDEVIVPSYTFYSSASSIAVVGAKPVFCDCDPKTFNMKISDIEGLITDKTKAIIPVHFAGLPCNMDAICDIAKRHNLEILEDCAHAHGTFLHGRSVGRFGRIGAFSFQNSKNLTCGEGGMLITDEEALYDAMVSRQSCGRVKDTIWYAHYGIGSNMRMPEMSAALLGTQLERFVPQTKERSANAKIIEAAIDTLPGLERVHTDFPYDEQRAYHLFCLRYTGLEGVSRETFIKAMCAEGAACGGGYPMPLHRQPAFASMHSPDGRLYGEITLPGTKEICDTAIWFSQSQLLGDTSYGESIAAALRKVIENADELREYENK